jgi:hypothetical protein
MRTKRFDYAAVPPIEFARLAAWIDGEGCLQILKTGADRRNPYFQVRLVIGQADEGVMEWLKGTFGGNYSKGSGSTNAQMYYWRLNAADLDEVLRRCMPYFILKGAQAEVVLAYRQTLTKGREILQPEVVKLRDDLRAQLKALKRINWDNFQKGTEVVQ